MFTLLTGILCVGASNRGWVWGVLFTSMLAFVLTIIGALAQFQLRPCDSISTHQNQINVFEFAKEQFPVTSSLNLLFEPCLLSCVGVLSLNFCNDVVNVLLLQAPRSTAWAVSSFATSLLARAPTVRSTLATHRMPRNMPSVPTTAALVAPALCRAWAAARPRSRPTRASATATCRAS